MSWSQLCKTENNSSSKTNKARQENSANEDFE